QGHGWRSNRQGQVQPANPRGRARSALGWGDGLSGSCAQPPLNNARPAPHPLFNTAALPLRVLPPMFNRYDEGMGFGAHVDGAVRAIPGAGGMRMRADVSSTLFLTDPD